MSTPTGNPFLRMSPAAHGGMAAVDKSNERISTTPNPTHPRHIFDPSMFMLDSTAHQVVSQPFRPVLPSAPSPHAQKAAKSPSIHYSSSSPTSTGASDSNGSSFDNGFLDPRSSSSPAAHETGISGNTTPGYDMLGDLEIPEFGDMHEELVGRINSLPIVNLEGPEDTDAMETMETSETQRHSTYPPSPRLTASPQPSQKSYMSRSQSCRTGPLIKVEHLSPETPQGPFQQAAPKAPSISIERDDDGSWQGGINPHTRGDEYLPFSLMEQELENLKAAKNADVEEWLKNSAAMLPKQPGAGGLTAPKNGRRRAKSVSDFRGSPAMVNGQLIGGHAPNSQDAPIVIDEPDDDDDDDNETVLSMESAWQGSLDEPINPDDDTEKPPTMEELKEAAQLEPEIDADLPNPRQFFSAKVWQDPNPTWQGIAAPVCRGSTTYRNQPLSAVAAIQRFMKAAENIETASRVATFGSNMTKGRRNSASDADKILPGPLKRLSFGRDKDKEKNKSGSPGGRRPSVWNNISGGIKRSLSSAGDREKNKEREGDKDRLSPVDHSNSRKRGNSFSSNMSSSSPFKAGVLPVTFGQPTLRVETSNMANVGSALAHMASPLMAAGAGANAGVGANRPASNGVSTMIGKLKRTRSRSDLQNTGKHIFGVVSSIITPALPSSTSPPEDVTPGNIKSRFTFGEESQKRGTKQVQQMLSPNSAANRHGDNEDEEMEDGDITPESTRTPGGTKVPPPKIEIIPTLDGFADHVRKLAPNLTQKLVDRIAHEQCKRFKKLVDHRHKHLQALRTSGQCANGVKCRKKFGAVGVSTEGIVNVAGHKRGQGSFDDENAFDSDDEADHASPGGGDLASAQFPIHVPTPPVSRLPAEFECPICFKTKKFSKPSDWTKHVHEDVQPFTCTFPDCPEPKSFKRKADWVRHENERHRHLEWWTCNQQDCSHICYRKDNFVQHLVREHKMKEPKVKVQKKKGVDANDCDGVWKIVEKCHQDTDVSPSSEKCRFCGAVCSTWKKLTVHLARHMEAISLPVLELIKDDAVIPVTKNQRRNVPAPTQQQPVRQPLPEVSMPMEIDYTVAPPRPSYDVNPSFTQPLPQYPQLAAPQQYQHQRSRSVGDEHTGPINISGLGGYPTVSTADYGFSNTPAYHHRSPHTQHTQIYNPQSGFDGAGGAGSNYQYFPGPSGFDTYNVPPTTAGLGMAGFTAMYEQHDAVFDANNGYGVIG